MRQVPHRFRFALMVVVIASLVGPDRPARAHPPAGIVADAEGRVTWIDGGSWRLVTADPDADADGSSGPRLIPLPPGGPGGSATMPHHLVRCPDGRVFTVDDATGSVHRLEGDRLEPWRPGGEPASGEAGRDGHPFAVDAEGAVWWVEAVPGRICRILRQRSGEGPALVAGGAVGHADGRGAEARFTSLYEGAMAWAPDGSLLVSDGGRWLRRVDADGTVRTILTSVAGREGPRDGSAGTARVGSLGAVAVVDDGTVVFIDAGHRCVRRIDPDGVVRTVGGLESDDRGGRRPRVRFDAPAGVAVDGRGGIWVLDHGDRGTEAVRLTDDGRIDRRLRWSRGGAATGGPAAGHAP